MANKVILVGHLGGDPELKTFEGGGGIATFSLATKQSWIDKRSGDKKEKTEWHQCVVWNRQAERLAEHMKKGHRYYVEGSLEYSVYEKEGRKHRAVQVRVAHVEFL